LEATLLKPFRAAFASGSDAVMIIPAQHTALDDQRAAITSRKVMHDFLRGELGFDGLIVTDDLNMYGARLGLTEDQEQGYEALKAGADILLYVAIDDAYLGTLVAQIETGLQSGDIDGAEFAASTKRILRYKQKYCLFEKPTYPDEDDMATLQDRIGLAEDSDLSLRHAEGAVVLLQNDGVLPLHDRRVLCIGPDTVLPDPASGWSWLIEESFCSVMKRMHPSVSVKPYIVGLSEGSALEWAVANHAQSDVIVVATFQSYFSSEQQSLLHGLIHLSGPPVVHVAQGVAFDAIQTRDKVAAIMLLQGSLPVMFEAGVRILWGDAQPGGHLLYDLEP
jgi:beta-N-acetylhexosaminidase